MRTAGLETTQSHTTAPQGIEKHKDFSSGVAWKCSRLFYSIKIRKTCYVTNDNYEASKIIYFINWGLCSMYKAYSLKINEDFPGILNKKPKEKKEIKINLSDFCKKDGTIKGEDLIDIWFPFEKYDIFLSHSHMDEELAYKFSNYLEKKFGIKAFIDSQVWEHMNVLIKELDKEFAYKENKGTYDYDVRNITTAHVHNMLSVALTKMMDACECIFFLNTKNSFFKEIEKTPSNQTYSSWIYLEASNISSLRTLIRRKESEITESVYVKDSITKASAATESFKIAYEASEIEGLPILGKDELLGWERLSDDNSLWGEKSLDALYKCVPMKFNREGEK